MIFTQFKSLRQLAILLIVAMFGLAACVTPPLFDQTKQKVDDAHQQVADAYAQHQNLPTVTTPHPAGSGNLTLTSTVQPGWMQQTVNVRTNNMSFEQVVNKVLGKTAGVVAYDGTVNRTMPLSIQYSGSIKGALDVIAARSGYSYDNNGGVITWSVFQTRTFDVSFMPGVSQYAVGETNSTSANSGSSSSTTNTGSVNTNSPTNISATGTDQYSNMQGNLSVWDDLQKTIDSLLSKDGKVMVSQATTTITVHDYPSNVRAIAEYLGSMNKSLSRQVALDVQVLEVDLNNGFNYGIDWGLVRNFMSGDASLGISSSLGQSADLTAMGNNTLGNTGIIFKGVNGLWNGSNMVINALAQQGKVSVVTQPRVVTLNNQMAEIGINQLTSYLAETSTTATVNAGNTVSLTPGQVITGFTLYLLPKVQGNDVYLQISSNIANLDSITKFGTGTQDSSGNYQNQIQTPTVSQKRFNQRSLVPSGATLILAGFKQVKNQANKGSMFGSDTLGGKGALQDNTETVVLITPTIVQVNQ